jgi:hypothetical protein
MARDYNKLSLREYIASIHYPRSHRNLAYLKTDFRKHYPIKCLYLNGYWLSVLRYLLLYILKTTLR